MKERTKFQDRVIKNYYQNREAIALQRAQELVTELYLAEGKKRKKHWESLAGHLESLGVAPDQVAQLIEQDNPELVANIIQNLLAKA